MGNIISEKLAATDGYAAHLHRLSDANSDTLLISFGDIKSGLTDQGFGTDWALRHGMDNVYVAQREKSQYQDLPREMFAEIVGPILARYRRIVCYGSSVGGYCAFFYGSTINADIVAAAPRLPAHPIIDAPRFRNVKFNHPHALPKPFSEKVPSVIFDPLNMVDSRFLFQWAGPRYKRMNLFQFAGAGHEVLRSMHSAGVLKKVIKAIIAGRLKSVPRWAREAFENHINNHERTAD